MCKNHMYNNIYGLIKETGLYIRNKVLRFVLYALVHYPPEVPSFYRDHKVLTLRLYSYILKPKMDAILKKIPLFFKRASVA